MGGQAEELTGDPLRSGNLRELGGTTTDPVLRDLAAGSSAVLVDAISAREAPLIEGEM
jgi:hypothetical protein